MKDLMTTYLFKSHEKFLFLVSDPSGNRLSSFQLSKDEPKERLEPLIRKGFFDNQGSPKPWTWAWTTDNGPFEIWCPKGLHLKLAEDQTITLYGSGRGLHIGKPTDILPGQICSIHIGKTSPISYGLTGKMRDASIVSLVRDSYPFWDLLFNVTYDGLCQDEDFFPIRLMGRELARRLQVSFDETLPVNTGPP